MNLVVGFDELVGVVLVVFGNVGGHGFGGVDVDVVVGYVQVVFEIFVGDLVGLFVSGVVGEVFGYDYFYECLFVRIEGIGDIFF